MARNDGEVSVTLLLNGGHSRTLFLNHRDPLLVSLVASIGEKSYGGGRPARPFNIHLDQGRQSFLFSSSDLVGLVTDPPLVTEQARQPGLGAQPAQAGIQPHETAAQPVAHKSPYLLIENFLDPKAHARLVKYVLERERDFAPSTVSTRDSEYRKSLVLHRFPEFAELFRERIGTLMPQLCERFAIPGFPAADIECQLTAHNDGHYYKLHNDNGSPDTLERTLTYVYYFHGEPKGFSGGEFRLYDSRIVDGRYECGEPAADIAPKNNSILFFPSLCHHEVLPVTCPSRRFSDSRFTINGWVRRPRAA